MAIGTSTTRLFQQVGAAIGVTVLGTIVNQKMVGGLYRSLPSGAAAVLLATDANTLDGLLLSPSAAAHIPAPILDAIRPLFWQQCDLHVLDHGHFRHGSVGGQLVHQKRAAEERR